MPPGILPCGTSVGLLSNAQGVVVSRILQPYNEKRLLQYHISKIKTISQSYFVVITLQIMVLQYHNTTREEQCINSCFIVNSI